MSITNLKTLCLDTVVHEVLWREPQVEEALLQLALRAVQLDTEYKSHNGFKYKRDLNVAKIPYHQVIETVLKKIMTSDNIPFKLKVKIGMNVINLERDVADTILELVKLLRHKNADNIRYCISKLYITTGKVDRCETILHILHDSYFEMELHLAEVGLFCCVTRSMVEGLVRFVVTSDRRRLKKRVYEMSDYMEEVFEAWKTEAMITVDENWDTTSFDGKFVFEYVALNAPVDVLAYFLKRMKKPRRRLNVSSALMSMLMCEENRQPTNLLFLLNNVGERIKYRLFVRYHEHIFKKLLMGLHSEYCMQVYELLQKHGKQEACHALLTLSVELLCTPACGHGSESVLYSNSKETFLNMWYATSNRFKSKLGTKVYAMLDLLVKKNNYHLLSTLINNQAYSAKQRFNYKVYLLSKLVLESGRVTDLAEQCPDVTVDSLKANMYTELLKQILLTKCDSYCFKSLSLFFKSESSECEMRLAVWKDKPFVIEAISRVAQSASGAADVNKLLAWIFNDDREAIEEFIQSSLLRDQWLIDIYKQYLLETSNRYIYPTPFLFECLGVSRNMEDEFKGIIRKDEELMIKLCKNFISPGLCDVTKLLQCLFSDQQHTEKTEFLKNFLISDEGLVTMYKLFECDYYNDRLYLKYGFLTKMKHYFDILQYWFEGRFSLVDSVGSALCRRGHPNSHPSAPESYHRVLLFPCESARARRVVTDANYRMFHCVIRLELHLCFYRLEDDVEKGIHGSLTRYVTRFAMRWMSYTEVPVVL